MTHPTPPAQFNMANYVLAAGRKTPAKLALEVVGTATPWSITYRDLEHAVLSVGAGLLGAGAVAGDRVLLRLQNSPWFPITYLGAIAVGLVPVPTSSQLTAAEVDKFTDIVAPKLCVASPGMPTPSAGCLVVSEDELPRFLNGTPAAYSMGSPERLAYIVFTSGTSAKPRAVMHAHRAVLARQMMFDGWYGLTPDDRMMHAGAFNWTYTMGTGLIDPWTIGATSLIPAPDTTASALPELMGKHDATLFAAAPGVFRKLLNSSFPPIPNLRHGLSAGEKLPETTRALWEEKTQTPVFEAYGMSECSTFISGSPRRPAPEGTLGYPQPGRRVRLADDGTISVYKTDPGLMLGYLDDPEETARRFDGDWFLTGDIGSVTADGAIRYEGRSDDIMNAGGLRVSPVEVEDALSNCAPTQEWACAEVQYSPDISLIAAFHAGQELINEDQIKERLAESIAAYKIPRLFVQVDSLPRGANNKLLRRQLRSEWEAAHGQT